MFEGICSVFSRRAVENRSACSNVSNMFPSCLRSHSTSQNKFLLTSQTACLHLCAVTGLSIDWPNFFSTEWSIPMGVVAEASIGWSKPFFLSRVKADDRQAFRVCGDWSLN